MNEDDFYRASTQYRFWSFTEAELTSLRKATNSQAAARVRDAIHRANQTKEGGPGKDEVDCLTMEEEQKLVAYYCRQAMQFSDFCGFPTNVKATAVQYLKRFYLSNSPMTYHPKQIMPSALFLSTKTENFYTKLKDFADKLPNTTAEAVIAPEFLLTQGLRFTFDVRHPHRGLEGTVMQLQALAQGDFSVLPWTQAGANGSNGATAEVMGRIRALQDALPRLAPAADGDGDDATSRSTGEPATRADVRRRIERAHDAASKLLRSAAVLSDAYLLYTPAQIGLAALRIADAPLARFYLDAVLAGAGAGGPGSGNAQLREELAAVLRACGALLADGSAATQPDQAEMAELKRIDKKLYKCRNPEKMDLVGANKAQKRNEGVAAARGAGGEEGDAKGGDGAVAVDEKVVKKRKLERERGKKEEDDVFGPQIGEK